jgi:hypothetical protein
VTSVTTEPPAPTLRQTADAWTLVRAAIGGPRQVPDKLARLARTLRLYLDGREIDRRLATLERKGYVGQRPTRAQILFGGLDMLRFVIEPASRDYYRQKGISFGFHQLLRVLDDPVSMIDPTGFLSDRDTIVGHVMQVVHLNPVYDLQLIEMIDDGLEDFERQVAQMVAGTHPRARSRRCARTRTSLRRSARSRRCRATSRTATSCRATCRRWCGGCAWCRASRWSWRSATPDALSVPLHRQRARAARRDVQEQECVDRSELAVVLDRQQALRLVRQEVGERHRAARQERGPAREQPDHDQHAGDELDATRHPDHERRCLRRRSAEQAEQLLRALAREEEARDDAQQRVDRVRVSSELRPHARPPKEWSAKAITHPRMERTRRRVIAVDFRVPEGFTAGWRVRRADAPNA